MLVMVVLLMLAAYYDVQIFDVFVNRCLNIMAEQTSIKTCLRDAYFINLSGEDENKFHCISLALGMHVRKQTFCISTFVWGFTSNVSE